MSDSFDGLRLRRSLEAFGSDEFEDVLADELAELSDLLPLQEAMDNGGWPDDSSVDVAVSNVSDDADYIYADLRVFFEENHPSGCANILHTAHYTLHAKMQLQKSSGLPDFQVLQSRNTTHDDSDDDADVRAMDFDKRADYDYRNSDF